MGPRAQQSQQALIRDEPERQASDDRDASSTARRATIGIMLGGHPLPPEAATTGHLAELRDWAADTMPAGRRAALVLIHHVAPHSEFARNLSLDRLPSEVSQAA